MLTRFLLSALLCLIFTSSRAVLVTYDNEADFIAAGGNPALYDFETASGFPAGSFNPADSLIGDFDGIVFDATVITPLRLPVSGSQAMSGANGTYSAASLDFTNQDRRITGFGLYAEDLAADEFIRVTANFRLAGQRTFDIRLGGAAEFTPIYFGARDTEDSLLGLSLIGLDDSGTNRGWYIDDLSLSSAAVPLPASLPLLAGGLLLLGRLSRRA